jgi:hypothetical protein
VDQRKQRVTSEYPRQHQSKAQHSTGNTCCVNSSLHVTILPCSKQLGHNYGASDIAAKGKRDENQRNFIAVAHGSKGILADESTGYPAVRNVVKLLKNNASEHWQAEAPQYRGGFPTC